MSKEIAVYFLKGNRLYIKRNLGLCQKEDMTLSNGFLSKGGHGFLKRECYGFVSKVRAWFYVRRESWLCRKGMTWFDVKFD